MGETKTGPPKRGFNRRTPGLQNPKAMPDYPIIQHPAACLVIFVLRNFGKPVGGWRVIRTMMCPWRSNLRNQALPVGQRRAGARPSKLTAGARAWRRRLLMKLAAWIGFCKVRGEASRFGRAQGCCTGGWSNGRVVSSSRTLPASIAECSRIQSPCQSHFIADQIGMGYLRLLDICSPSTSSVG